MGLLTTVKETVLGEEVGGESADETTGGTDRQTEGWESEVDFVIATGRTRTDALLELVEANGGRMKQSELVRRTEWSKATVSRYLGELEDEGAIDRVPVGRCKVVLLPDESLLDDPLGPEDAEGDPTEDAAYPRT